MVCRQVRAHLPVVVAGTTGRDDNGNIGTDAIGETGMPTAIVTTGRRLRHCAALAASLFGLLAVMPCQLIAGESPALRTAKEVFRPGEPIYVFIDHPPTNNWAWLTVVPAGAPKTKHGHSIYLRNVAPADHRRRWYTLPPQAAGDYELRLYMSNNLALGATLPVRVAAGAPTDASAGFVTAYADRLIGFVAGHQSRYPEPFGHDHGPFRPNRVDPAIVLGDPGPGPFTTANPQLRFLTLPKGSSVTLGFTSHVLVDAPGPDFFVRGLDPAESAGEVAEVFVSTDGDNFVLVDQVMAGGLRPLDLAGLGLSAPVTAIRVVGTDLKGSYPGFELVSVELAHALLRGRPNLTDPVSAEPVQPRPPGGGGSGGNAGQAMSSAGGGSAGANSGWSEAPPVEGPAPIPPAK